MKKSITENYIYNLLYQVISLISPLILVPFLTRALGGINLGVFSYTLSIITIFYSISALGLNLYGQREIAYLQDDKEKRSTLFYELIIIRFFSTILTFFAFFVFLNLAPRYNSYYYFFIPYLISNLFDITWLYQGMEDFKNVSLKNIVIKFVFIFLVIIFIRDKSDLNKYIFIYSIQFLLTAISFWIDLKKYVNKIDFKKIKISRHISSIFVFFIPQIATTIYTILDKTMIGILTPHINNVYYYEQATYIVKTILMLVTTVGTVMVSNISYYYNKKDYKTIKNNLSEIIKFVWFLGMPLLFGICACIGNIVPWFYGSEYNDIIYLTYYLAPLIIIIGLNNILGYQILIPLKKQNHYVKCILIGMFCNIMLNFILIKYFGTIGAAISSVISELVILILEYFKCKEIISLKDLIVSGLKYILFGTAMFVSIFIVNFFMEPTILTTIIQIAIGIIIYMLLLIISSDNFFKEHVIVFIKSRVKGVK